MLTSRLAYILPTPQGCIAVVANPANHCSLGGL